jgi:hypothetical protein
MITKLETLGHASNGIRSLEYFDLDTLFGEFISGSQASRPCPYDAHVFGLVSHIQPFKQRRKYSIV